MTARYVSGWLALIAALTACADPVGVCDRPHACEVAGPDLELVRIEVANPLGTNPITNLPEAPRELELRYVVRNRGSVQSDSATVRTTAEWWYFDLSQDDSARVPRLAPGDSAAGLLRFRIGRSFTLWSARRDVGLVLEHTAAAGDAVAANDTSHTSFELSIPALELIVRPIGVPRIRANELFPLWYTLHNASRYESAAGIDLYLCLFDGGDIPCVPAFAKTIADRFGPLVMPPGGSFQEERTASIQPTAAWQDEAWDYGLALCAVESTWPDAYAPDRHLECAFAAGALRVRPDYQSCNPPLLQPGSVLTHTAYNCGFVPPTLQDRDGELGPENYTTRMLLARFHLTAMDLVAGRRYSLLKPTGGAGFDHLLDAEGERQVSISGAAGFTVPRTGRYYAATYSGRNSPPELQLILREL